MKLITLSLLSFLALPFGWGDQDEPVSQPQPGEEPWEVALGAFQDLGSHPRAFVGEVTHSTKGVAEQRVWFGGQEQDVVAPFEGAFEGYRWSSEEVIVRSLVELPGFQAWQGDRPVIDMLVTDELIDVHGMLDRALPLIDPIALARVADAAEWSVEADAQGARYLASLSGDFANPPEPGSQPEFGSSAPVSNVLRVECALRVDEQGRATSVEFQVVWNDVNAIVNRLMDEGGFRWDDIDGEEPVDGAVTTWKLEWKGAEPSAAVLAYRERVQGVLERESGSAEAK